MSESYPIDFTRVPKFFDYWNTQFKVINMRESEANFEFVFSTYCGENIDVCLNGAVLDTSVVTIDGVVDASLKWENEIISVNGDVVWNVGARHLPFKAVFLRDKSTKCVMGYSINQTPFNVTNRVIISDGTILWSISDGK